MGFDAEGVDLGRTEEMAIATFQGFNEITNETPRVRIAKEILTRRLPTTTTTTTTTNETPIYVVDVEVGWR